MPQANPNGDTREQSLCIPGGPRRQARQLRATVEERWACTAEGDPNTGARRVIVAMQHTAGGKSKIVPSCTLALTSIRHGDLTVTELVVIASTDDGLPLKELAPGISLACLHEATAAAPRMPDHAPTMALNCDPGRHEDTSRPRTRRRHAATLSPSFETLLAARLLQGLGAGAPRVVALAMPNSRHAQA